MSLRRLIYTVTFPPFQSLYTHSLSLSTHYAAVDGDQMVDLISSKRITVESPLLPYLCHLSCWHPSFMSWNFSIQSVSVSGNLVITTLLEPLT
ncbi:hypothetical protein HanPSC8_Chr03g0088391 [Helianthus annuus]|nr:hypothetical protein HanPSC8_Chr03g0088391 [Helianthus annuus]